MHPVLLYSLPPTQKFTKLGNTAQIIPVIMHFCEIVKQEYGAFLK